MKILVANHMERCICCHSCSLACARLVHSALSWTHAGIRIHSSGGMTTGFEAKVCLACKDAACAKVCPSGALIQRRGGGIIYKRGFCIGCRKCATACPVEAILSDRESGSPYVCIHCGRCVAFCPHQCLSMMEVEDDKQPSPAGRLTNTTTVTANAPAGEGDAALSGPAEDKLPDTANPPGNILDKEVRNGTA